MTWTDDELNRIGEADELQVSSYRSDGTLRPFVTIWVVRTGDNIYIRSAYGRENGWYRRALTSGRGQIRAGGVEKDVTFVEPAEDVHPTLDAAYHDKYDRYGQKIVGTVVAPHGVGVTLRLEPEA
ncbi:DUF2255 family protein [Gordonia insulae]|uniref:Pyridoxamine 5'-phosphate oxidase putative domain-containing protein n=1 Tax=Gordonia insulae TaxID=2420509 RepID=A0A3G8JRT7_9ACTN|nr:DUF2255 family protein [Gordonia insulae]AZG47643.1 hypothetical protein D7316_04255 [Gordonia insulae]